jgi:pyruvate dehydrogenase E2 component (dihydrolipoamide acetyltransferase)
MSVKILMPALSPTMTEGNLAKWLKKEGDAVKSGEVIAEIETDKATMEVEAVDEGILAKIVVPAGAQGVKVNELIGILAEEGESTEEAVASANKGMVPPAPKPAATSPTVEAPHKTAAAPVVAEASSKRQKISPLAKRLATMLGIETQTIKGTGPNGRILRADIEKAKSAPAAAPKAAPAPMGGAPYEAIPNSGMRKVIASRLSESKRNAPHFYLTIDCQLDELLALRKKINVATGSKLSVNDFIIRAVALSMKKVPASNASWTDEAILQYRDVDVSVAVASPAGLITPIVRQADTKSLSQISTEMKDLAARARDGKLKPHEYQGGGFTISNLGMFGVKSFSAIINPPQACILAIGAGEERPVVKNGAIVVANVMTVTLSVDHRAVDGAVGANFLAAFKELIEQPYGLLA